MGDVFARARSGPVAVPSNPASNQSESGGFHTAAGLMFRAAVNQGGSLEGHGLPKNSYRGKVGRDSVGVVVREQSPLWKPPSGSPSQPGYRDLFGAFVARAAFSIPVISAKRYQGQLPFDQQPVVDKPNPWDDPTRGQP